MRRARSSAPTARRSGVCLVRVRARVTARVWARVRVGVGVRVRVGVRAWG